MPGLLDFTSDPQGMQGLALLAAAAPSMAPQNFAGRLAQAGSNYQGLLGDQLKQQFTKAQIDDMRQQIGLRGIQLQQAQQQFEMMKPILSAVSQAYSGQGAGASGSPPSMPSQPGIPPTAGGALGSGTFGVPMGGQSASAPAQPSPAGPGGPSGSIFGVPMNVAGPSLALGGPAKFADTISQYNAPTDLMKSLTASGLQPGSPEWIQAIKDNIAKNNYIAPLNARPGSIIRDPRNPQNVLAFNPHVPEGTMPKFDASGSVVEYQPIGNAEQALALAPRSQKTGTNQVTPSIRYVNGVPTFSTVAQDVNLASGLPPTGPSFGPPPTGPAATQGGGASPALIAGRDDLVKTITGLQSTLNDAKEGSPLYQRTLLDIQNAQAQLQKMPGGAPSIVRPATSVTPVPQLGAEKGATLSQSELGTKGASLMADNANTNTVISRLQNIKMLTPGAITGAEAGRRDFFNGLLSLAGVQGATDAKTASDLVDKNSAQIISALRMGQGGAGTDALQTLLGAANPNRHMTQGAINEAVDQLIASQKMIQDKARILQPQYLGRDPVAYGAKELQFDQNADPRVWQLQSMNPQQQAAYVKTLPPAVAADVLQKRRALKQLGVFQ